MIFRAEEAASAAAQGGFPTWGYGAIALTVFVLLAAITWSYRDVANRSLTKGDDHQGSH
jgi:hypothetical protein